MDKTTQSDIKPSDFKRDLKLGDQGEDVKKVQEMFLLFASLFGYEASIDPKELKEGYYGATTKRAADQFLLNYNEQFNDTPLHRMLGKILFQIVFHEEPEEVNPAFKRGERKLTTHYRDASDVEIESLTAGAFGAMGSTARIANVAKNLIGLREEGDNRGSIVRACMDGREGLPWCGGFVHYVMEHAVGKGVYNQDDFMSALSYEKEASKHGAWRGKDDNNFKTGDVLVFSRGDGKGHVGIVTDIAADGTVTYVDGNDGNAVSARTFNANNKPHSLLGHADTQALAHDKGIELDTSAKPPVGFKSGAIIKAARFDQNAILRG